MTRYHTIHQFLSARRILTSSENKSNDLCKTKSKQAIRMASERLDFLDAYIACSVIANDKNPGVRPIGIGEVRRSLATCLRKDFWLLRVNLNFCVDQRGGIACDSFFPRLIQQRKDGSYFINRRQNAFNSLNRDLSLCNIQNLCPSLCNAINNSYTNPSILYIASQTRHFFDGEGTTQGDLWQSGCIEYQFYC